MFCCIWLIYIHIRIIEDYRDINFIEVMWGVNMVKVVICVEELVFVIAMLGCLEC